MRRGGLWRTIFSAAQLDQRGKRLMNTHLVCVCECAGFRFKVTRRCRRCSEVVQAVWRTESLLLYINTVTQCTWTHMHTSLSLPCALTNKPKHLRQGNVIANVPPVPSSCFIKNQFALLGNALLPRGPRRTSGSD